MSEGEAEGTRRSRRVIPRLGLTIAGSVFFGILGLWLLALAVFGTATGSQPWLAYVMIVGFALIGFGLAAAAFFQGSFLLTDGGVRPGWPRSRWVQ